MSKAKSKDIKKAIKAFINHVETLEKSEEEDSFEAEYKLIQDAQAKNRKDNVFSMDIGKSEGNLKKNRYKDILPYDDHRIVLSVVDGDAHSDYINASKLTGVRGTGGYIATQGPLATTVSDFWRMIWEYNVEIIFMVCRIVEMGKIKCKQYWNDLDKSEEFGDITVFTEAEEGIMSDCVQRNFRVSKGEEVRHVIQYHYSGWPDHGIPDDAGHIRDMIGIMRQHRHNDQAPLLVHCSAGCGRTGAIIAIDYVWTLLEEGKFDESFNLFKLICDFREQRMSIVQTADQYALVNKVLKSLCEEWLTKMASHTYENVMVEQGSEMDKVSPEVTEKPGRTELTNWVKHDQTSVSPSLTPPGVDRFPASPQPRSAVGGCQATEHAQKRQEIEGSVVYSVVKKKDIRPPAQAHAPYPSQKGTGSPALIQSYSGIDANDTRSPPANTTYSALNHKHSKPPPPDAAYNVINPRDTRSPPPSDTAYSALNHKDSKPPPPDAAYNVINPHDTRSPPPSDTAYSALNHKHSKPPPPDAAYNVIDPNDSTLSQKEAVQSIANKKAYKAPTPPALFSKSLSDELYSAVKKIPAHGPTGAVAVSPPSHVLSPSAKSEYSTINQVTNGSSSSAYEVIEFSSGAEGRRIGSASVELSGQNSSLNLHNIRQVNYANIPGFNQRLPRVRGPVTMPQSWNKT